MKTVKAWALVHIKAGEIVWWLAECISSRRTTMKNAENLMALDPRKYRIVRIEIRELKPTKKRKP